MTARDRTVLIVDDDEAMREVVRQILQLYGFVVVEGTDGLDALQQIRRIRPGVVVMDLSMPRLGGITALKGIRAFDPAIRIVVLTGETNSALHREALAQGASQVITKPFDCEPLVAAVTGGGAAPIDAHGTPNGWPSAATPNVIHAARVVIVDEQPAMARLLVDVLASHGFQPHAVTSAADAVENVRRLRPDLVLYSIDRLSAAAFNTLGAIQAVAPRTPVIAVSESSDLARRALDAGAFDCLTKPIDVPFLLSCVQAALSRSSGARSS